MAGDAVVAASGLGLLGVPATSDFRGRPRLRGTFVSGVGPSVLDCPFGCRG